MEVALGYLLFGDHLVLKKNEISTQLWIMG
jgi:hypothetical protein